MSLRGAVCRLVMLHCKTSRRCLLIDATNGFGQFDRYRPSTSIGQQGSLPDDASTSKNTDAMDAIGSSTEQTSISTVQKQIATLQLLHRQRRADDAFELMTVKWSPAVDYLACYRLTMDLLFENGHYSQVAEVWRKFQSDSRLASKLPYPQWMTILVAASCYKLNSAHSYEQLLTLIDEMSASKKNIPARTLAFAAATAMNQNDLNKAREVLELVKTELDQQPNTLIQSLKVVILAKLKRFDEALDAINALLAIDQPAQSWSRGCIADGALDDFCAALKANSDFKMLNSFRRVQKTITASGRRINKSIEQLLLVPIAVDTSLEDSDQLQHRSSDDNSVRLHSDRDNAQLTVENPQLTAYKAALQKRVVKRIMEHGPLQVENYRR